MAISLLEQKPSHDVRHTVRTGLKRGAAALIRSGGQPGPRAHTIRHTNAVLATTSVPPDQTCPAVTDGGRQACAGSTPPTDPAGVGRKGFEGLTRQRNAPTDRVPRAGLRVENHVALQQAA